LLASEHEICAVYTQPDRPAGRGRKLTASAVKKLALQNQLPVFQPGTLKNKQEQQQIAALNADVMVVVAYGLILPAAVIDTPRFGCLNIHASLLPRWRGAAPIQRAILAGDSETGITIMQMDEGLDTGDMLVRLRCPIERSDTAGSLHDRLAEMGGKALLETLIQIKSGTVQAVAQDNSEACYARKIEKSEALVDWGQSAKALELQVRAFNPWPIAQVHFNAKNLRIWAAKALAATPDAQPGTVVAAGKDGLDIATGEGTLRLLTVQLPGGKPVSVGDFLNAQRDIQAGFIFGKK
jgi:methionyl-tRNA formyltransferase